MNNKIVEEMEVRESARAVANFNTCLSQWNYFMIKVLITSKTLLKQDMKNGTDRVNFAQIFIIKKDS